MKFLLVSDLHKSYKSFKGQDESVSVEWLLGILDETKPDFLLGAGDWGEGVTPEDISRIISKVQLLTVYGNHENFPLIKPHSLPDGKVVQRGGLKIAGVNGLIGEGKREYMIAPDDFVHTVKKIKRVGEVDVFLAHQPLTYLRFTLG
ncbi:metallophosphoesterase family protein [Metallosphaera hakonensis]|uniref:metallophosphoesterase family protein n=1 Tax=Metallosphaera hakonensis TaxID=79601 RepID=UPI000A8A1161|nr:metallophosphoesterase [Metallosphaera hakonensis]